MTASASQLSCGGSVVAEVQCLHGGQHACKALLLKYPSGERTVLYRAPDFDVDAPDRYVTQNKGGYFEWALYPVLAPDGSRLWFKERTAAGATWREYEFATGVLRELDDAALWEKIHFEYRDRDVAVFGSY